MDLQQDNSPYTVFVPSNEAFSNMKADALDYLLSAEVQSFYNTNLSQIVDIYQMHTYIIQCSSKLSSYSQGLSNQLKIKTTPKRTRIWGLASYKAMMIPYT